LSQSLAGRYNALQQFGCYPHILSTTWRRWLLSHRIHQDSFLARAMRSLRRIVALLPWCASVCPSVCLGRACIVIIRCTLARISVYGWVQTNINRCASLAYSALAELLLYFGRHPGIGYNRCARGSWHTSPTSSAHMTKVLQRLRESRDGCRFEHLRTWNEQQLVLITQRASEAAKQAVVFGSVCPCVCPGSSWRTRPLPMRNRRNLVRICIMVPSRSDYILVIPLILTAILLFLSVASGKSFG